MQAILQTVLGPILSALDQAIAALSALSLTAQRGLNIGQYLAWIGWVGPGWSDAILSLVSIVALLVLTRIGLAGYQLYLKVKAGVMWW